MQTKTEHPDIFLINVCEFIISTVIFNNTSLIAKHYQQQRVNDLLLE